MLHIGHQHHSLANHDIGDRFECHLHTFFSSQHLKWTPGLCHQLTLPTFMPPTEFTGHTYRWRTSDVPNLWHAWPVDTGQPKWNSVLRNGNLGPGETFGGCFCLKTEENIPKFYFYYLPPIFLIFVIFLTFTARKIAKLSKTWCPSINHFWQFRFLYLDFFRTLTVFPRRYTFYF